MTWWEFVAGGALGLTALLGAALGVLMVAQRAKAWWSSRWECDNDDPEEPVPDVTPDEARLAMDALVGNDKELKRCWKALSKAPELRSLKRAPRRLAKEGTASRRLYRWTRDRLGGRR